MGGIFSFISEIDIPNLNSKTILITGGNCGLGFETARLLAKKGANVIIACRDKKKAQNAVKTIKNENPQASIEYMLIDLNSLDSVRNFAEEYKWKKLKLDILVNNAGVLMVPFGKTMDGFESHFGVNYLSHFLLVHLLLPILKSSSSPHIFIVSSMMEIFAKFDINDINYEKKSYGRMQAYCDSKLADTLFAYELHRRINLSGKKADKIVRITLFHPGQVITEVTRNMLGPLKSVINLAAKLLAIILIIVGLMKLLSIPSIASKYMARTVTRQDPASGVYYFLDKVTETSQKSYDAILGRNLWELSEKLSSIPDTLKIPPAQENSHSYKYDNRFESKDEKEN